MSFHIQYKDIRSIMDTANTKFKKWDLKLNKIYTNTQGIVNLESFQGNTADSVKCYLDEVHSLLYSSVVSVLHDYQTKILLYSNGYYDTIDMDKDTIIVEEVLNETKDKYTVSRNNFEYESNRLNAALQEISDIFYIPIPRTWSVFDRYTTIDTRINDLVSNIMEYEQTKLTTDLADLENLISAVNANIKEYSEKEIKGYQTGDYVNGDNIIDLATQMHISMNYNEEHKDGIIKAIEHENLVRVEIQEELIEKQRQEYEEQLAKARKDRGIATFFTSAVILGLGVVLIVATLGTATPVVAFATTTAATYSTATFTTLVVVESSAVLYSASNMVEGAGDWYYGTHGEIYKPALNPIRDIGFAGNQDLYDMWGKVNVTIATLYAPTTAAINMATSKGVPVAVSLAKLFATDIIVDTVAGVISDDLVTYLGKNMNLSQTSKTMFSLMFNMVAQVGFDTGINNFSARKVGVNTSGIPKITADDISYGKHWDDVETGKHSNTPGMDAVDAARDKIGFDKLTGFNAMSKVDPNVVFDFKKLEIGKTKAFLDVEGKNVGGGGFKTVDGIIESSFKSNLTQEKIYEIVSTSKGSRPAPSTYLSQEFIKAHLAQFDDGASIIMTKEQYITYVKGSDFIGIPSDGTQFVLPKNYCDEIASMANGNINVYEKALGFDIGHFEDGGGLVKIDIDNVAGLNLRMPAGNEAGANSHWIPGGKTDGDVPEAISDLIPNNSNNVSITELK